MFLVAIFVAELDFTSSYNPGRKSGQTF